MPNINVDSNPSTERKPFVLVPEGEYQCQIIKVEAGYTRSDVERWNLTLEVITGEFAGSRIWDSLFFSPAKPGKKWGAIDRVRCLCRALHLEGDIDLKPSMLRDEILIVTVDGSETFVGRDGNERTKPKVAFLGFGPLVEHAPAAADDDDIPF